LNKWSKVGILTGGRSAEREVSLATAQSVENALKELNMDYSVIYAEGDFTEKLVLENIDVVFIAMHGGEGENGCVQGLLEVMGIPYTGSGVLASALCMNKVYAKQILEHNGIKTPQWQKIDSADDLKLELPVVIKPVSGGSTVATSIVREPGNLEDAFRKARELNEDVLVEKYIPGKEITVGILDSGALPVLEIESMTEFYDYEAKYMRGMSKHYPLEGIDKALYKDIQDAALKAFTVMGCESMARVDMRLHGREFYVLEINTIPGMTPTSLLPEAAQMAGMDFPDLICKILESATKKTFAA
jgi:D-alanine-D-alanine ligase